MARHQKNNADYFPHLTTMRNHRKVKALRAKFGSVLGYAFWAMILEYLTELDGNELDYSDFEMEMFAGELGVSVTEIQDMVKYCLKIELLFTSQDNFLYSDSLNEVLKPVFDKRNRAKEISKTRKRHKDGSFVKSNDQTLGETVTVIPQQHELQQPKKPRTKPSQKEFVPPTLQEVISYFVEKGYSIDAAKRAYDYYNEADWYDRDHRKVVVWKSKMNGVWFKPENKASVNGNQMTADKNQKVEHALVGLPD